MAASPDQPLPVHQKAPRPLSGNALFAAFAIFCILTLKYAVFGAFPSEFDELAHLSYVAEQAQRPTLFPDLSTYRTLKPDLSTWSSEGNYLNHPSLYYLLLAPFSPSSVSGAIGLRIINVVLVASAMLLVLLGGMRLLVTPLQVRVFSVAAVCFPKTAAIGSMTNNDNLAVMSGALVFIGLIQESAWLTAGGLALAGWTKLTALVALGAVVAFYRVAALLRGDRVFSRFHAILAGGALLASLPYLVNLARIGHLLYWRESFITVPDADRLQLNVTDYIVAFGGIFSQRWSADEGLMENHSVLPIILMIALLALLVLGAWVRGPRSDIRAAYLGAMAAMLGIHLAFGWSFYRDFGNITTPEPRYYAVLWPGLALAFTCAITRVPERWRTPAVIVGLAFLIWPTLLGRDLIRFVLGA